MTTQATEDNLGQLKDDADRKAHKHNCLCGCCMSLLYWTGCKCCCCDTDDLVHHGLDHIVHERHCTDVPVLMLFIVTLLIDLALLFTALDLDADPRWLLYYADWEGNICAPGEKCMYVLLCLVMYVIIICCCCCLLFLM